MSTSVRPGRGGVDRTIDWWYGRSPALRLLLRWTLIAGLTVWAFRESEGKVVLFISGLVSLGLGFYVLFNLGTATLMLLGTLLAVQTLLEGLTLIAVGRVRPGKPGADPTA